MKRLLSFFILFTLLSPLFANDWGTMTDVKIDKATNYSPYIIFKIINGEAVTYCIDGNSDAQKTTQFEQTALRALRNWFSFTAGQIEFLDRTNEFKDIYPLLKQEIKLQKVNCSAAFKYMDYLASSKQADYPYSAEIEDLRLILLNDRTFDRHMDRVAGGVMRPGEYKVRPSMVALREAKLADKNDLYYVIMHELGHMLGLSDQYMEGRNNSDPAYGTSTMRPSIMGYAKLPTCDDADGIINIIDCKVNNISRAKEKGGWVTLCPEADIKYIKCNEAGRAAMVNLREDISSSVLQITEYNADGSIKNNRRIDAKGERLSYTPLQVLLSGKIKQLKYNNDKQIASAEDENGIITYFNYFPDSLVQMISTNPKEPDTRPAHAVMRLTPVMNKTINIKFSDNNDNQKEVNIQPANKNDYTGLIRRMGRNGSKAVIYKHDTEGTLITACLGNTIEHCKRGNPYMVYYYEDKANNNAACIIRDRRTAYCVQDDSSKPLNKDSKAYTVFSTQVEQIKLQLNQLVEASANSTDTKKDEAALSEYLRDIAQLRSYAGFIFNIFDSEPVRNDQIKKELQDIFKKPKRSVKPYLFD